MVLSLTSGFGGGFSFTKETQHLSDPVGLAGNVILR